MNCLLITTYTVEIIDTRAADKQIVLTNKSKNELFTYYNIYGNGTSEKKMLTSNAFDTLDPLFKE